MTTLRRSRGRAASPISQIAAVALALMVGCLLLLGTGRAMAGTRSHTHHLPSKPLPVADFSSPAGSRGAKKSKSGSGHGGAGATGSRQSRSGRKGAAPRNDKPAKTRRGHVREPDPVEDDFPRMRAGQRGNRRSRRDGREFAQRGGSINPRSASVDRRTGRAGGRGSREFAAMRAAAPPLRWRYPARSGSGNATARSAQTGETADGGLAVSGGDAGSGSFGRRAGFAQGVSRPAADNEESPRSGSDLSQARIGTAQSFTPATVIPAPASAFATGARAASASAAQVVQGFGSEVAVASPDGSATRLRNRPTPAGSGAGGFMSPPTLEERDAITEAAITPAVLPEIYDRDGRLLMPAPMKGSHEVLLHQNTMANSDGLERIRNDADLDRLRAEHALVGFPASEGLHVNDELPMNRRCARPWTVLFAEDIARDFFARFHQQIWVTSAARTMNFQARLQRVNGNAAAVDGEAASPHLTGQAIDLAKGGMSAAEIAWMRAYLMPLMSAGKIDVEEEFQQACFHISVYRRYAGGRSATHELAQVHAAPVQHDEPAPVEEEPDER